MLPACRCVADPDSTYLSFANPNYCFEDQLNSNGLQSPTDDDGSLSFDKLSVADGTHSDKHIYANRLVCLSVCLGHTVICVCSS